MNWRISKEDQRFKDAFLKLEVPPSDFSHRSHVRLAYIFLNELDVNEAYSAVKRAIQAFLSHFDIDSSKYHETLTMAWLLAVKHFMMKTPLATSAADFIEQNLTLLDSGIMLTHYSKEQLFSDEARQAFVEPDLDAIPLYS